MVRRVVAGDPFLAAELGDKSRGTHLSVSEERNMFSQSGRKRVVSGVLLGAAMVMGSGCGPLGNEPGEGGVPLVCDHVDRSADGEVLVIQGEEITLSGTYRVSGRQIYDKGQVLTIEPGTVFLMESDSSILFGWRSDPTTVFAQGTADAPILFCGSEDRKGHWQGLQFLTGTTTNSYLEHVRVEDAARGDNYGIATKTDMRLSNVAVTNGDGTGFGLEGLGAGSSNLVSTENAGFPAHLVGESAVNHFPMGEYMGNGEDLVTVRGLTNTNVVFKNIGIPYQTTENIIFGRAGGPLTSATFEAGVEFQFCQDCKMTVGWRSDPGALYVNGTEENPVIFTSSRDTPRNGDWNGIELLTGTTSDTEIVHAIFEYGGKSNSANLFIDGGRGFIDHSHFANSSGYGLLIDRSVPGLTIGENLSFENNDLGDRN